MVGQRAPEIVVRMAPEAMPSAIEKMIVSCAAKSGRHRTASGSLPSKFGQMKE
jgi:hypothetical protein